MEVMPLPQHARFGQVSLGDDRMNYVEFGAGERTLVMIPGLGDGLAPLARYQAKAFAAAYRQLAGNFHVYCFSRRSGLPAGSSTRDMARDQAAAMKALGITTADVLGVSQGGMIAQYLAIDHPELVRRLVLTATLSGQNDTLQTVILRWMEMARQGKFRQLMIDTAECSYSADYLLKYRLIYPFLGLMKPKSLDRFLIQAASCIRHDARSELGKILCPTCIIGGSDDRIVGTAAARELAAGIPNSKLYVYKGLGHALYEEAPDFQMRVTKYLLR